jgi:predicted DNA-binding transcriptional regulator AlpA
MTLEEFEEICAFSKLRISPAGLLREIDFAKLLGKSARTLGRYRELGTMPPHIVLGNQVWYPAAAIAKFLSGKVTNTDKLGQTWTDADKKDIASSALDGALCSRTPKGDRQQ